MRYSGLLQILRYWWVHKLRERATAVVDEATEKAYALRRRANKLQAKADRIEEDRWK